MKSPKARIPKPMKARRMWANYHGDTTIVFKDRDVSEFCAMGCPTTAAVVPVAVIPLDDVDEIIARAYGAYCDEMECFDARDEYRDIQAAMRAALTAIGVLPKKRKGRK